jgi:hypothetical protein
MNTRDTAQALYAINWEVRAQNQMQAIPLEAQAVSETVETIPTVQQLIQTAAAIVPAYDAQPVTGVV